jgi:hypothetical protein
LRVFKDVIEFSELEWNQKFEESVGKYKVIDTNFKWKEELTYQQQTTIEKILGDLLRKYGY